jgi:hypothetical protein
VTLTEAKDASGLDDGIYVEIYDENLEREQAMMDEIAAQNATQPIFIFSNGDDGSVTIPAINAANSDTVPPTSLQQISPNDIETIQAGQRLKSANTITQRQFLYLHFVIKSQSYFYDNSGTNNFEYSGFYWGNNSSWDWIENSDYPNARQIWGIKKNQCNGTQYTNWGTSYDNYTHSQGATTDYMFCFNAYERDWYASVKQFGHVVNSGVNCFLDGRESYTNDTYLQDSWNGGATILWGKYVSMWQYLDFQSNKAKVAMTRSI